MIETHGLKNVITEPTCHKSSNATLIDVILTSNCRRIAGTLNTDIGLSDYHNLVAFSTKLHLPRLAQKVISYRSYKHFDEEIYKRDISFAPFHVGYIFDEFDDTFWFNQTLLSNIIDSHAPVKRKRTVKKPLPCMNSRLRKECHRKSMLRNKYFKYRSKQAWENYRKSRNKVSKLKAVSMHSYFKTRCNSHNLTNNPSEYWNTIKPFMSDKYKSKETAITIQIKDDIINDPKKVGDAFDEYFSSVALGIGNEGPLTDGETIDDILCEYDDHDSIKYIRNGNPNRESFNFSSVCVEKVKSMLDDIDSSKATGFDNIPPKLLKSASQELAEPVTNLVNQSIRISHFPHDLKKAELSPLYKCKDDLIFTNYRPVSVLTSLSKLFERVYNDQMAKHFMELLSSFLSAFRRHFGCHHVHAYGMSREACKLILSYLRKRLQRVKIASVKSDWSYMIKGVPQGSVLGPLLFNIFLNDTFFVLSHNISIYNYADDNTIGSFHEDIFELKRNLEMSADIVLTWFDNNQMKVNPEKFQTLVVKKANEVNDIDLNISGQTIKPTSCVKLLGLFIDDQLTFDKHVSELCMRVTRQTNALRRIVKYLTPECKIIMYTAFIASNFNYCHIVWHFCGLTNSLKIEKLHKKSLNVVLNDYLSPYHVLLQKVKRPTMYVSRMKAIGFDVFKCLHNCSPSYITDMFRISATPYATRGGTKLIQPKVNTTRNGLKSFRYQGAKIWNELPTSIKNTEDVSEFKYRLNEWPGPVCKCGSCDMCKFKNI